ncbi:7473_t:CDS:2, partial [Gigaspora margarita]
GKKEDKKNKTHLTLEQKHDFLKRYMTTYLDLNTKQKIEIITQDVERVTEGDTKEEIWIPSKRVKQVQTKMEDTIMTRETDNKEGKKWREKLLYTQWLIDFRTKNVKA